MNQTQTAQQPPPYILLWKYLNRMGETVRAMANFLLTWWRANFKVYGTDFNQLNAPYYPTTIPTVLGEPPNNIILTCYKETCQAFAPWDSEVIVFGLIFS